MKDNEMLAALVTQADKGSLEEAIWFNSAGLGDTESQWERFEEVFTKAFGISWKEAEELAKRFF